MVDSGGWLHRRRGATGRSLIVDGLARIPRRNVAFRRQPCAESCGALLPSPMTDSLVILHLAAAGLAVVHTALGPDHYLPFAALGRARGWTPWQTARNTALCGLGHVLSSLVLAAFAVPLGLALSRVEAIQDLRGDLAAWALVAYGVAYTAWVTLRRRPPSSATSGRPWFLFPIFVLGPCEPMVPLVMAPAVTGSLWVTATVAAVFLLVTLSTMVAAVLLCLQGIRLLPGLPGPRATHAAAGLVVTLCGLGMVVGL